MLFRLTNAPATFVRLMDDILQPFTNTLMVVYLYDILIFSRSLEEHLHHIWQVLQTLRPHKLCANLEKCTFGLTQVQYMGYIIDEQGVHVDPSKSQAIQDWPTPTTLTELCIFLGLTNFYCRFRLGFTHITWPLSQVTKGGEKAKQLVRNPTKSVLQVEELPLLYTSAHITRTVKTIWDWDKCLRLCYWCGSYSAWASSGLPH